MEKGIRSIAYLISRIELINKVEENVETTDYGLDRGKAFISKVYDINRMQGDNANTEIYNWKNGLISDGIFGDILNQS